MLNQKTMKKFVAIKFNGSNVIWNNETESIQAFDVSDPLRLDETSFNSAIEAEAVAFYLNDCDKIEMNNIFSNIKQDENEPKS